MSTQQVPPELPEEALICDWLIKELGDAQNWDRILELMRALSNVRRLAEEKKSSNRHGSRPPLSDPLDIDYTARHRRAVQLPVQELRGNDREPNELETDEDGPPLWETDPETM